MVQKMEVFTKFNQWGNDPAVVTESDNEKTRTIGIVLAAYFMLNGINTLKVWKLDVASISAKASYGSIFLILEILILIILGHRSFQIEKFSFGKTWGIMVAAGTIMPGIISSALEMSYYADAMDRLGGMVFWMCLYKAYMYAVSGGMVCSLIVMIVRYIKFRKKFCKL